MNTRHGVTTTEITLVAEGDALGLEEPASVKAGRLF